MNHKSLHVHSIKVTHCIIDKLIMKYNELNINSHCKEKKNTPK